MSALVAGARTRPRSRRRRSTAAKRSWLPYGRRRDFAARRARCTWSPRLVDADRERLAEAAAALRSAPRWPDPSTSRAPCWLAASSAAARRWPRSSRAGRTAGSARAAVAGTRRSRSGLAPGRRSGPRRGARTMRPVDGALGPGLARAERAGGSRRASNARLGPRGPDGGAFAAFAARVHAPEAAPMMVRLVRSRVSKLALDWLHAHPERGLAALPDARATRSRCGAGSGCEQ